MLLKFISWLFHRNQSYNTVAMFNSIRINAIVNQLHDRGLLDIVQYEKDVESMIIDILNVDMKGRVA